LSKSRNWPLLAVVWGGLASGACGTAEQQAEITGPLMRPGQDCLSCHSADSGRGAPVWSAAGTVYARPDAEADEGIAGADVLLSHPDGSLIAKLTTNSVGNFYTPLPLPVGFRVAIEHEGQRIEMPCSPPAGLCNFCHGDPPTGRAAGRIHVPQGADPGRPPFDCSGFNPQAGE
jgi:hypothetical protein